MSKQSAPTTQDLPESITRSAHIPYTRFAFQISFGLHALLVLVLFRAYIEYGRAPEPPLHIVVRGSAPRTAATPSFVTTHVAAAEASENSIRPSAAIAPLPHQSLSLLQTTTVQTPIVQPGPRRGASLATLPTTTPVVVVEGGSVPGVEGSTVTPTSRVSSQRAEALPDMPLRVAMRPVYGRREQRPLGLASLPTIRSENQHREPADAFVHRFISERTPRPNRPAIERGLEYLARVQLEDGRWRFDELDGATAAFPRPTSLRADAAASGLALLAFLGAGHDHFDGRYQRVIEDGLEFLVRIQQLSGEFCDDDASTGKITTFYSHGIATLALCEAFGMTGDATLRAPAQRALDHLAARLESELLRHDELPRLQDDWSVFGWQLATLRSGQLAGLQVDPEVVTRISNRMSALQLNRVSKDTVSTAVGLAVELHLHRPDGMDRLRPAADELLAHSPEIDTAKVGDEQTSPDDPRRDSYYWYYGSEAMYYLGGDDWQAWSRQLYPRLIDAQITVGPHSGSWDTAGTATAERIDVHTRLYGTAMNLLTLETEQRQPTRAGVTPILKP